MEWEHEHGDQCIGCTYICQSHYFLPIPDLCPACECKAYWDAESLAWAKSNNTRG